MTLTCLTTVRLTLGSTVTLVSLEVMLVLFSVQLTVATLVNVPFVNSLTCIQTETLVPLAILSTVQTTF